MDKAQNVLLLLLGANNGPHSLVMQIRSWLLLGDVIT